ncbi:MAG: AbrB/MazE/SpoVT family DNA-binding domain-containing protein [Thermoanaerobacteraceae bacterium]|nr:AbrB/MazE/SpoVT family DNA-binding domain-containing protein [Thermoanaerobacteraceae bacterium]
MKSTGIVRKVDDLGRVVIPIELRRTLDISEKDPLEIYVDTDKIILKKYLPACLFCGNAEDLVSFRGKSICKSCASAIKDSMDLSDTPIHTDSESIDTTLEGVITNS